MNELTLETWLPQAPAEVFGCFEDVYRLRRWYGAPPGCHRVDGDLVLVEGESFRIELIDGEGRPFAQTATLVAREPERGLTIEMRWLGGDLPQEPSRAVITIEPAEGGTRLTLRHVGLAENDSLEALRTFWQHGLSRLARVTAGEAVPCFEEFRDESKGFVDPVGLAAYVVLAGLREAGALPETVASVEETLYSHLSDLDDETSEILGAVLRERLRRDRA